MIAQQIGSFKNSRLDNKIIFLFLLHGKKIKEMSNEEIAKAFPVELSEYRIDWPVIFEAERHLILSALLLMLRSSVIMIIGYAGENASNSLITRIQNLYAGTTYI
jgi:hypothetical protein